MAPAATAYCCDPKTKAPVCLNVFRMTFATLGYENFQNYFAVTFASSIIVDPSSERQIGRLKFV